MCIWMHNRLKSNSYRQISYKKVKFTFIHFVISFVSTRAPGYLTILKSKRKRSSKSEKQVFLQKQNPL